MGSHSKVVKLTYLENTGNPLYFHQDVVGKPPPPFDDEIRTHAIRVDTKDHLDGKIAAWADHIHVATVPSLLPLLMNPSYVYPVR